MDPTIFISYRQADSASAAGRIRDRLVGDLGCRVFLDVESSVGLGANLFELLAREVEGSEVVLAVIGRRWLSGEVGRRRIDDPNDYVRFEIERARSSGVTVIPVLVDGASMPRASDLPPQIRHLSNTSGIEVRSSSFHQDLDRLIESLAPKIRSSPKGRSALVGALLAGCLAVVTVPFVSRWLQSAVVGPEPVPPEPSTGGEPTTPVVVEPPTRPPVSNDPRKCRQLKDQCMTRSFGADCAAVVIEEGFYTVRYFSDAPHTGGMINKGPFPRHEECVEHEETRPRPNSEGQQGYKCVFLTQKFCPVVSL